ncbi:MAG: hypothetical protein H9535_01900 [Ignavibacteria bacterium]|nr:hypothetical protein [Ignavibacteria bacterium]
MKTIMNSRRAFISAAAGIALAFFVGVTACQQDGSTSPIAALDDLNSSSSLSASAVSGSLTSDDSDLDLSSGLNIMALAGGSETRPEAVLEIKRRPLSRTSTETGGEASARFDNTLGVTGVSVAVLGTTYQFVTPPMRPNNGNGRGPGGNGNGNPNSTNANAPRPERIASTLFVFPAPPATNASTTLPALITLTPVNATATFTVSGYALADNALDIPGNVSFTSLKSGDALSRASNLSVRWNVAGTFTNGVVVLKNVLDSTALAGKTRREIEQIRRNLPKPITKQLTAGAASVDFTAAELTALQAGSAEITVGIVNAKRTNSDKAILIARTNAGARITLQ